MPNEGDGHVMSKVNSFVNGTESKVYLIDL
jgi:hypothetical protein